MDDQADYGNVSGKIILGLTRNCYDATGAPDCSVFAVAGARPSLHWDATVREDLVGGGGNVWTLHIGDSFSDVPRSQPFYKKIETLLHHGITSGCGGNLYCPGNPVPRDQMAIFVAKAMAGAGELVPATGKVSGSIYDCSVTGTSLFADVAPTDPACRHVHFLASQNVTLGCGRGMYLPGPDDHARRDGLLHRQGDRRSRRRHRRPVDLRARSGDRASPTPATPDSPNVHFTDVPVSSPFCKHVHYLWAKGIAGGCSATQYCPTQTVARDAMAKFIANGFGLQLYGP